MDYDWYVASSEREDAVLLVSRRKTKRYLLFDNAMRLMGWKNIETGERSRSPYQGLDDPTSLNAAGLSALYLVHPLVFAASFPLMDRCPTVSASSTST